VAFNECTLTSPPGEKWVSTDGKKLSFTADTKDQQGKDRQLLYVFDRTGS
jgi:hypothetical protein